MKKPRRSAANTTQGQARQQLLKNGKETRTWDLSVTQCFQHRATLAGPNRLAHFPARWRKVTPHVATLSHRYLVRKNKKTPASGDTGARRMRPTEGRTPSEGRLAGYGAGVNWFQDWRWRHPFGSRAPITMTDFGGKNEIGASALWTVSAAAPTICAHPAAIGAIHAVSVRTTHFDLRAGRTPLPSQLSASVSCHLRMALICDLRFPLVCGPQHSAISPYAELIRWPQHAQHPRHGRSFWPMRYLARTCAYCSKSHWWRGNLR